jgi:hypothetical protein
MNINTKRSNERPDEDFLLSQDRTSDFKVIEPPDRAEPHLSIFTSTSSISSSFREKLRRRLGDATLPRLSQRCVPRDLKLLLDVFCEIAPSQNKESTCRDSDGAHRR